MVARPLKRIEAPGERLSPGCYRPVGYRASGALGTPVSIQGRAVRVQTIATRAATAPPNM
jgi:hypothetical protein